MDIILTIICCLLCGALAYTIVHFRAEAKELQQRIKNQKTALTDYRAFANDWMQKLEQDIAGSIGEMDNRVCNLENGVVPDFESAKEAVKQVNDFSSCISSILGYDPYSALEEQRKQDKGVKDE